MLQNYADNLIRPAFREVQTDVNALSSLVGIFMKSPTAANLTAMQTAWLKAQRSYEAANAYNVGPAGEAGSRMRLVEEVSTFPVNTLTIEKSIAQGLANTNDANYDARGLLAIEYMLFDKNGNNARILEGLETASRMVYLNKLVTNVKVRVDDVVNGWDGYVTTVRRRVAPPPSCTMNLSGVTETLRITKLAYPSAQVPDRRPPNPNWPKDITAANPWRWPRRISSRLKIAGTAAPPLPTGRAFGSTWLR